MSDLCKNWPVLNLEKLHIEILWNLDCECDQSLFQNVSTFNNGLQSKINIILEYFLFSDIFCDTKKIKLILYIF